MIRLLPIALMCLVLTGCNTAKLTKPVFEEQTLPPGHPWRMDTITDPSTEQSQMSPRTPEEQSAIEVKNAANLRLLQAEAEKALAGCTMLEKFGSSQHLAVEMPNAARLILVECDEAPTRLCLKADGKLLPGTSTSGVSKKYGSLILAYCPNGHKARTITVDAVIDMGNPFVPAPKRVGRVTVYYK